MESWCLVVHIVVGEVKVSSAIVWSLSSLQPSEAHDCIQAQGPFNQSCRSIYVTGSVSANVEPRYKPLGRAAAASPVSPANYSRLQAPS
ncbi:hypothetical protein QC764_0049600 [Podospora pseudoanserina]|uniref:Uncharacterized protein n=1 Tax=Podospora pseudoanserina TaxID=2609844 RepID=A0ABR0IBW1_9PEZI|nr:hypothetical protein QC764_0049600 [Podospora pseudoanserina]